MRKTLGLAALAAVLACGPANAQQVNVKIGVLSDMSSLYADIGGPGSVAAAKMAIADFTKDNPNVKVEMIVGDHQNKPDIGSQIANQWYDVDKVDMIIDVPNSGVALSPTRRTKCSLYPVRQRQTLPDPSATPIRSIGLTTRGCWRMVRAPRLSKPVAALGSS